MHDPSGHCPHHLNKPGRAKMLVLTRKAGEAIAIGDQITIKVLEVKGTNIRVGIEAPPDFRIYREEIYVKVKEQNRLAAHWDLQDFEKVLSLMSDEEKE
jgi:carbon storage regulator